MQEIRNICQKSVSDALNLLIKTKKIDTPEIQPDAIQILVPPNPKLGDLAIAVQMYAKLFSVKPQELSAEISNIINSSQENSFGSFLAAGPYVNVKINRPDITASILKKIATENDDYGSFDNNNKKAYDGRKVMIEFSSPNTNKPLHLGHLRNDALGESVSRILEKVGAEVFRINLINNRGVHICKSMYAYRMFHEKNGETPEKLGIKGDHFVGQCYVEFEKLNKQQKAEITKKVDEKKEAMKKAKRAAKKQNESHLSDEQIEKEINFELDEEMKNEYNQPTEAEKAAEALLIKWEKGDPETLALWKTMNDWTLNGIKETYKRTGISFDKFDFESETYLKGRDEVMRGLEQGIFFRASDNSIRVNVSEIASTGKEDEEDTKKFDEFECFGQSSSSSVDLKDSKVLLRGDGTSLYMTQDIGTAIGRHNMWPFNQLVYVVANEQNYHFKCLFYILRKLGYEWANKLFHLSYGLVNLPEGRMKSREGTIVDADDLIDSLHESALKEMNDKKRDKQLQNADEVAEKLALSALHYYLLQVTPIKDMMFDPKKSLSFKGNTGPYLQYVTSRIASILDKAKASGIPINGDHVNRLVQQEEWELIKILSDLPVIILKSAEALNPGLLTQYVYDVAKIFNKFYEKLPIINEQNEEVKLARLYLLNCTFIVMKNAMHLVLVPFLEAM